MVRLFIPLVLMLLCSGCSSFETSESEEISFTIDSSSYAIAEPVTAVVKNQGISALYFNHCCGRIGFFIEQRQGEEWERVRTVNLLCNALCDGSPVALEAGDSFTAPFELDEPGRYRLALPYGDEKSEVNKIKLSPQFVIK